MNFSRPQRGLSMIELMVALAISSFLIVGVTQIYIDNKRSYTFQQSQSENQEGSRYSLIFLQQELAKAGYRRRPDQVPEAAFPSDYKGDCSFEAGQTIKRINASSVCIRYQPRDEEDQDCQGNAVATDANVGTPYTSGTETFFELISFNKSTGELTCVRQDLSDGRTENVMISGLADLRFVYGVGTKSNPREVSEFSANPDSDLPVLAVRFITLTRSTSAGVRDTSSADDALKNWKDYSGATAAEVAAMKSADNNQLYQFSQNTVTLRNLMP